MKFKKGDKVTFINNENGRVPDYKTNSDGIDSNLIRHGSISWNGNDTEVVDISAGYVVVKYQHEDRIMQLGFEEKDLKLVKKGQEIKPKTPTHLVVWEEDTDPCKFFNSEPEANDFIKELSEKREVKQDSIVLVEIKTARKVTIQKSLRKSDYKI